MSILTQGDAAAAEERPDQDPATPVVELRHDEVIDVTVTSTLMVGNVVWALVRKDALPESCVWCDGPAPHGVNGFDAWARDALARPDGGPARLASDILAWGVAPVSAFGLGTAIAAADRRFAEAPLNGLLVAESVLVAMTATEIMKSTFRRERPYLHAAEGGAREAALESSSDAIASFPSGHATATFALAASATTVATMRGYRLAPLVGIVGAMLAGTTSYLRIAGDRHYLTDVLGGAVVGTGFGIGVPLLFHRPKASPDASSQGFHRATIGTAPIPGGRMVTLGWMF